MRSELLVAHEKLGQFRCWRCTLCPCKVRNTFLINFWNRTILLCIPCIHKTGVTIAPELLRPAHISFIFYQTWSLYFT
jgi:hypothetical protein